MHNVNTRRTNGCPYAERPLSRCTDGVAKARPRSLLIHAKLFNY